MLTHYYTYKSKRKYVKTYKEFIMQLHMYAKAIIIVEISLRTPSKLQEMMQSQQQYERPTQNTTVLGCNH